MQRKLGTVEVRLDPREHAEWRWCSFEEALELVNYRGLKDGLRSTREYVTGLAHAGSGTTPALAGSGPLGEDYPLVREQRRRHANHFADRKARVGEFLLEFLA